MEENLTSQTRHRISRKPVPVGRVSNPFASPGQNGGFSDGFLTKRRVDACHSGQPGKSSDPKNPMKLKDDPPSEGFPPVQLSLKSNPPSHSKSVDCDADEVAATGIPERIPAHLTRRPGLMTRKRKRSSVVEIGVYTKVWGVGVF
jgi:hypothetical protein